MFTMFKQMFAMFAILFTAGETAAKSLLNITTIGEEMSAAYLDEQRSIRKRALAKLEADAVLEQRAITAQLAAPVATPATQG
jgi:hypothetical protein